MRLFRNKRAEAAEARLADLEAAVASLRKDTRLADLEALAKEFVSSIPIEPNELGVPDNKRRIVEAFELARLWQEKRDA